MNHIHTVSKCCDPLIIQLATKYNKIVKEIKVLICKRTAPLSARASRPLEQSGLFALDIDDSIWEDIEIEEEKSAAPPWLCNKNVQKGIKLVLQFDRCEEEEWRIKGERQAMQEWFAEE